MQVMMLIIMTPVELIGKIAKPFALAVRLFANMTAGHFVILSLLGLIIVYGGLSATGVAAVSGSLASDRNWRKDVRGSSSVSSRHTSSPF